MDFQESSDVREGIRGSLLSQELLKFYAYLLLDALCQGFIEHRVHALLAVFDEPWEDLLLEEIAHDVAKHVGELVADRALDLLADHRLHLGAIHATALRGSDGWRGHGSSRIDAWLRNRGGRRSIPLRHWRGDTRL